MYVTDLTHFDGIEFELEAPGPALRLATYLRRIVMAATSRPAGTIRLTALRCRRRPGRSPCPGRLLIEHHDEPYGVKWQCEACDDAGVIDGWQGSLYDLSGVGRRGADGREVVASVSDDAYRLLVGELVPDRDCERLLYAARPLPKGVELSGSEADFEELIGFVAFEANHAANRERQRRWDAIVEQLESALTAS